MALLRGVKRRNSCSSSSLSKSRHLLYVLSSLELAIVSLPYALFPTFSYPIFLSLTQSSNTHTKQLVPKNTEAALSNISILLASTILSRCILLFLWPPS